MMHRHLWILTSTVVAFMAALLGGCGTGKQPDLVQLPEEKPAAVMIKNVAILDVESGKLLMGHDVLALGDSIAGIAETGLLEQPDDAQVIDGTGATLLPGLIEMHSHLGNASAPRWVGEFPDPPRNMQAYLYSGVTTVFDAAGLVNQTFKLRNKVAVGELLGPRMYAAGPIFTAVGGHPAAVMEKFLPWWLRWYIIPRYTRQVDTDEAARAAVREIAGMGADAIKVAVDRIPEQAPRIKPEVLQAVVEEASQQNLRTVAHIGSVQDAIDAAEAGVALWVHGVYQERIPDEQIQKLASYQIPMVATLVVFEGYALLGRGAREPSALERETVSPEVLLSFDNVPKSDDAEYFRPYLENLYAQRQNSRDNVRRLHEAGMTILVGSDTQSGVFPGAGLHREMLLLQESGMTPAQIIKAATIDAARYLANGKEPTYGVIQLGKQADLLLVEGNPLQDLNALSRIRSVIKAGVPLERRALGSTP